MVYLQDVVGYNVTGGNSVVFEAFMHNDTDGMTGLGFLDDNYSNRNSRASDVSSNGEIITGYSTTTSNLKNAIKWTDTDGMVSLGTLQGDDRSEANGISSDGSTIVGFSSGGSTRGFIWDEINGMQSLQDVLENDHSLTQALSGWTITNATSITNDGLTITGNATNPDGDTEAFIAHLGSSSNLTEFVAAAQSGSGGETAVPFGFDPTIGLGVVATIFGYKIRRKKKLS